MTKGAPADRKLYYGLTRVSSRLDLEKLCDAIASRSTASRGDIKLVLEGLIYEMCSKLTEGLNHNTICDRQEHLRSYPYGAQVKILVTYAFNF
jgi:hypothetical protein